MRKEAALKGKLNEIANLGQNDILNERIPAKDIVHKDLITGMNEVGIGGEYMTHEHTLKHCRDAVYGRTFNQ